MVLYSEISVCKSYSPIFYTESSLYFFSSSSGFEDYNSFVSNSMLSFNASSGDMKSFKDTSHASFGTTGKSIPSISWSYKI